MIQMVLCCGRFRRIVTTANAEVIGHSVDCGGETIPTTLTASATERIISDITLETVDITSRQRPIYHVPLSRFGFNCHVTNVHIP